MTRTAMAVSSCWAPLPRREPEPPKASERQWAAIAAQAPTLAATSRRYLDQIALSLRPTSVIVNDACLRTFCAYVVEHHLDTKGFAQVGRTEIEGFKAHLGAHVTAKGTLISPNTRRGRLGLLRTFFDRIVEWDWPDAPARTPIFVSDLPRPDEPLPRFLDDGDAARLARAITTEPDRLRRLVLEILSRAGLRVGELCALEADAVMRIGNGWWLRVPLGKLHNDRLVPLHPVLVELLGDWQTHHDDAGTGLLLTNYGRALNRHMVTRMLNRVARRAGLGHVHPHQLRHTLATQAVNRGMRIEAIAALLGHRTLRMTIRYARIANRTVAEEYQAVTDKVDALYAQPPALEADAEGPTMRAVRAEHHRMLANGWCTRPAELDCSFEALCEGCGFFATGVEFLPTLRRQRDHAATHNQPARAELYGRLLAGAGESAS
jgi:integrase